MPKELMRSDLKRTDNVLGTLFHQLRVFISDKDMQGSIFISVSMVLASIFSYLLQLFLGNRLSLEDFASFTALLSLSAIVGVPSNVFSTSLTKVIAELNVAKSYSQLKGFFKSLIFIASSLGLFIVAVVSILHTTIANYLGISDSSLIILFAFVMGTTFLSILPASFLQGLLRYTAFAGYTSLASFLRFFCSALAVYVGFNLYGAFSGMLIASILLVFIYYPLLYRSFTGGDTSSTRFPKDTIFKTLKLSGPVFLVTTGMLLLNNIDVILVKHFFSGRLAGYYSGVVTLGKIILFGTGSVATVMYPKIANMHASHANVFPKFKQLLTFQLVLLICGMSAFILFPSFITKIFFGSRFLSAVPYLRLFTLFIGIYVLDNFLVLFLLGYHKIHVWVFILGSLLLQVVGIHLFHDSLYQVIYVNIVSAVILLGATSLYINYLYILHKSRYNNDYEKA